MNRHLAWNVFTWIVGIALLTLIVAYLAGAFRDKVEPAKLPSPESSAPSLTRFEPVREETEPLVEGVPGTISALRESLVSARITASIQEITVRSGDRIQRGQTLVRLDARDLTARERQAGQVVAAAKARLNEAQKEYERMRQLVGAGAVSRRDFDAAEAAQQTARAEVARAEQAVAEAGTGRDWATMEAPFDGRVVDRYAEPGDTAMPGQALLKIYDPSRLRLEAYVRESLAGMIRPGQPLQVRIDALQTTVEGRVDEVVPQSEPGSRSVLVKVSLPQRDDLYPGMFGRLLVPGGDARRLYIPEEAVRQVGQLSFAWVAEGEGKRDARRRFIKLGPAHKDGAVEVISGLRAGEWVGLP